MPFVYSCTGGFWNTKNQPGSANIQGFTGFHEQRQSITACIISELSYSLSHQRKYWNSFNQATDFKPCWFQFAPESALCETNANPPRLHRAQKWTQSKYIPTVSASFCPRICTVWKQCRPTKAPRCWEMDPIKIYELMCQHTNKMKLPQHPGLFLVTQENPSLGSLFKVLYKQSILAAANQHSKDCCC